MKRCERGTAVFIFKILVVLSGQLRTPTALSTGKYSPVDLAVERRISVFTEAVWTLLRRDKYVASARNRKTIPRTLFGGRSLYQGCPDRGAPGAKLYVEC
jgi:hypothetical protein